MQSSDFTLTATDGTEVFVHRWLPDGEVKAVVQIAHGLAEHSGRYARFAQRLTDHGYAVYANDHRGHGKTSGGRGLFAERGGWCPSFCSATAWARFSRGRMPLSTVPRSPASC